MLRPEFIEDGSAYTLGGGEDFMLPEERYVDQKFVVDELDYDRTLVYGGLFPSDGHKMGLWASAAWQRVWPCVAMDGSVAAGPHNGTLTFCVNHIYGYLGYI